MATSKLWGIVAAGVCFGAPALADGSTIEVQGKQVDLATLKQVEVTRPDLQLGAQAHYRGVPLQALLATVKGLQAAQDTVVLRFKNGMAVPLPRDPRRWKQLDPFIALQVERDGAWSTAFPPVAKVGAEDRDVHPLVFTGTKFVVATADHPSVAEAARLNGFTPFAFVDSLVGVDVVAGAQREKALRVVTAAAAGPGFAVFLGRCQFCHGVNEFGAHYGRDFAAPSLTDKDARELLLHVRYRDRQAPEKGLMMPFFKDVTNADVAALLTWIRAVGS